MTFRPIAIAAAVWLLTGLYVVRADEQAVVRRFGAVIDDRVPPGLHFGLPWGIDAVDRLKVREQKRLTVGFELPDEALGRPVNPGRREFFTGDQNLVNIELLVQYTIREPRAYLFAAAGPTETLRAAAEAAVAATVASRPVDTLLTTGKLAVQEELRQRAQAIVDAYGLGIALTAVNIQAVSPPLKVADAFREVASAREDRDRIIKEAESYANATLPAAEGEAARLREEAVAYRDQKIAQARGDAARFVQSYEAYRLAPGVTTARLYLETVEEILPRLKVIAMDRHGGRSPVDLNLLPRSPATRPSPGAGAPGAGNVPETPAPPPGAP
jgi:membrane protease subunit HflK